MCRPGITQSPGAVFEAVEDANLAVDGACGAPVAVAVEGDSLDQILVAMLHDKLKLSPFLHDGRFTQEWRHFRSRWQRKTDWLCG